MKEKIEIAEGIVKIEPGRVVGPAGDGENTLVEYKIIVKIPNTEILRKEVRLR